MTSYRRSEDFRAALEARLGNGRRLVRARQLVVFERFLVRALMVFGPSMVLKGGLALEARIQRARTTRDVDLRLSGTPEGVLLKLREAGGMRLDDHMHFEVVSKQPLKADGLPYSGHRYRAECHIGGRLFGQPFHVDVAFGEPFYGEPESILGHDWLAFAGLAAPRLPLYPVEAHLAEKLHAYSLPRSNANTRVKDLPDLALLGTIKPLQRKDLRAAIDFTFGNRGTHPMPSLVQDPSPHWKEPYAEMAREYDLHWRSLAEVAEAVKAFLDPVLQAQLSSSWSPERWSWD